MNEASSPWPETIRLGEAVRFQAAAPLRRSLEADEASRKRIAKALDLVRLDRLEADLALSGWFDGLRIEARWAATVAQTCGVSLELLSTDLGGAFSLRVVPPSSPHAAQDTETEIILDLDAEDPPDVLESDLIDLGGYVVEHLALEIDPFPRKPGAVFTPPEPEAEITPFAALRDWKPGGGPERS